MRAGHPVNGTNISGFAATILSVDSANQVTISANATGTQPSGTLVVAPNGMVDATHFNTPDYRGRGRVGRDDMGGSVAGRVTVAGTGTLGTRLAATGGAETVTLTQATLPSVTLATSIASGQGSHTHTGTVPFSGGNQTSAGSDSSKAQSGSTAVTINAATLPAMTGTTPLGGSGTAHQNMGPFGICNTIIKT
jgi:microcystin-dependent protein